jgi:F-type H+-transporting ATPase subunit gamma
MKETDSFISFLESGKVDTKLFTVGRKGTEYYRKKRNIFHQWNFPERQQHQFCHELSEYLTGIFMNREIDELWIIYSQFRSVVKHIIQKEKIIPIRVDDTQLMQPSAGKESTTQRPLPRDYIYEPDLTSVMFSILPVYLRCKLYRCILESSASEYGARMTAMEQATKNAADLIDQLTLKFNKARQTAITREILDIVVAAEAIKKG